MSAALRLRLALRSARLRVVASAALLAVPPLVVAAALAWRLGGPAAAILAGLAGLVATAAFVVWRARRIDRRWLARTLDARRADMEDSAALLFAGRATLSPLQRLQRERLRQRIATAPMPDLRPSWPRRGWVVAAGAALLALAAILAWPAGGERDDGLAGQAPASAPAAAKPAGYRLRIEPPAYTGLEAHDAQGLDAAAPEGSRLRWLLRFDPQPRAVELAFHDGRRESGDRVALERDGDRWTATRVLEASTLYRVVPDSAAAAPPPPLHRLDAIADAPPVVRVLAPEGTLSTMGPGQRRWSLAFEATDDYGVAEEARLHLTLAKGTGENITFIESARTLRGTGGATRRRFSVALDPIALGLEQGEDLVARLEVRDNRAPRPQAAHSPSLILRWPPAPLPDIEGLDALARDVLPAYFRSQRQIIIDAEALLEAQGTIAPERFMARSDGLGVDQRVLRLRYGQFLGEEAEGAPQPLPVADAEPAPTLLPIDDLGQEPVPVRSGPSGDGESRAQAGMLDLHDHEHDQGPRDPADFGSMQGVLEEYAHLHDLPEAATLLDPRTRETLRKALGEMWQSELALRQGEPDRALPYAYRALDWIQQVREADRIYLARMGSQLPPVDEGRRLGGDRDGIGRRPLPPSSRRAGDGLLEEAWRALAGASSDATAELGPLEAWLADNRHRVGDPLSLAAAIDALRQDPGCSQCRDRLRAQLWTLLERPATRVQRRSPGDAVGARYLDALQLEQEP